VPFGFLFCGLNIFSSSLFTALSNGTISATISFLRTLGFLPIGILALPAILGIQGLWLAIPIAEGCTWVIAIIYIWTQKGRYQYV